METVRYGTLRVPVAEFIRAAALPGDTRISATHENPFIGQD